MHTQSKKDQITNILLAVIIVFFIISFSVTVTLNFRPLYYFDIGFLNIERSSGISADVIRENYDTLINYNLFFNRGELNFPSLPMSEEGRIHFVEVKNIFVAVQYLCIITFVLGLGGIIFKRKKKSLQYLKLTSILTLAIPTVLGLLVAINWDTFFVTFHKIFFNNDYWIFDYRTDPVILILPDTFFMHCAIMILLMVVAGSGICYLIYRKNLHKN